MGTPLADTLLRRIENCEEGDSVYIASGALANATFYNAEVGPRARAKLEELLASLADRYTLALERIAAIDDPDEMTIAPGLAREALDG